MDLEIGGRVALVTGGSRGLGRESALSLAKEGVSVAICGRTQGSLDTTVREIEAAGVSALGVVADVSDASQVAPLHERVVDGLGPVDILVNNVGGSRPKADIVGTSLDDLMGNFHTNLFGGFQLMKMVLPHMRSQRWGRIVNIASIFGREYGGESFSYMTSKAALIAATKHAAVTLAKDGVLVNSIAPGSIQHPGGTWERYQKENSPEVVENFIERNLPMGRFGWPQPVGDLVAFLASERAGLITGASIVVDGAQGGSLI